MALFMIGIGLSDEKDITVKGLEAVKRCSAVYLESYTSLLQCSINDLEKFYGRTIIAADRGKVEKQADEILERAKEEDVAFLVIGDALSATTHISIILRAKEKNIPVHIIHNASILTAVGITGLQLYKFGRTTSLPFDYALSRTAYSVIEQNKSLGMHTLVLLDIVSEKKMFMTVNQAIGLLLKRETEEKKDAFTEATLCVGCARLGSENQKMVSGAAGKLFKADFGGPVHCLVVPGKLHFMEEEALGKLG